MDGYFNHVPLPTFDANDITNLSRYPKHGLDSLDVDENYFFAKELEHVIPEMLMFEHGRISARNVFPMDNRAGPGAEVVKLRQMTKTGAAKIVTDYANDIPLSNVFTEETSGNVRSVMEAAQWSFQEIRNANLASRPIDRDKTDAAREDMLRLESRVAWAGDAVHGIAGFFTDANIPRFTVAGGVWSGKTGAQIVTDLNAVTNPISENTNGVEAPDTLVIPRAQYNFAATLQYSAGSDTTALQYFVNTNPYINSMDNVIPVDDIAGLGAGAVDTVIAYHKHSSKLTMITPLDIEQFPPQVRDAVTRVIYHMRVGGVLIKKPLSIRIAEGV